MNIFLSLLPFLISFGIGYFVIQLLENTDKPISAMNKLFLGMGLGLGISSYLTFLSFIIFNQFHVIAVLTFHSIILSSLVTACIYQKKMPGFLIKKSVTKIDIIALLLMTFFLIPLWIQANLYPHGGWDAWAVWNFKAKILFLEETHWQKILDPSLWRSSPHYPLLLPLINVWGWSMQKAPIYQVPLITTLLFAFLTAGISYSSLQSSLKGFRALLPPTLILCLPFLQKLFSSQYCDSIVGFYLLASLFCIIKAKTENHSVFALLSGIFIGFMSFTKSEGLVIAGLLAGLCTLYLLSEKETKNIKLNFLLIGITISALLPACFYIFYSPGNQTFVNGLVSLENPSTFNRLKVIFIYYFFELKSLKWNGLWWLILITLILSKGRCFQSKIIIIPQFLGLYAAVITFYYFTNTHFEIVWWLQVTLNRILSAVLPTIIFWSFYSVWNEKPGEIT